MQQERIEGTWINQFTGATTTSSVPSLSTHGIAVPQNLKGRNCIVRIRHAATGARTFTVKLWGYVAGELTEAGAAVSSSAGWNDLNESWSMASTSTDGGYSKRFEALTAFSRLYVQITAISGTGNTLACAVCFTEN